MEEDTRDEELLGTEETSEDGESGEQEVKWEKRYKDAQAWGTKNSQEVKKLRSEIDQMKGYLEAQRPQSRPADQAPTKDWLDEANAADWIDDPDKLKGAIKSLRKEMAEILTMRDRAYDEKIQEINPRTMEARQLVDAYKDEIAAFRDENPDMEDATDLIVAKFIAKQAPKETTSFRMPPVGGRKVVKKGMSEQDKAVAAKVAQMYPKELGFE
jgi:hypothetical protein